MPETKSLPVKDLDLDLENYRTIHQSSEKAAIEAMVATSADWFWALVESLADDGYLPTENIIVLRGGDGKTQTVREGNRRVAALKILLGLLPTHGLAAPTGLSGRIA